jgi:hypothetical protein
VVDTLNLPCPKCRGVTWLETVHEDIVQRCLCGLHRYIQRKIDGIMVYTAVVKQSDVVLPRRGTKIYRCFSAIGRKYPKVIMTADVARNTGLNNKEAAALLIALQARGLIQRASERRGIVGGSEWRLTTVAESFFRIR